MGRPATRPIRHRRNNHPPTRRLNMTAHIDTLKEWWENAEVGDPKDGDVIIEWAGDGHAVRTFLEDERDNLYAACTYRILARAPKPKPAWHDAVAVIAETGDDDTRRAFVPQYNAETGDERLGTWADWQDGYDASELIDPVPLIEAKVTDEARERVWRSIQKYTGEDDRYRPDYGAEIDGYITAALGLETA